MFERQIDETIALLTQQTIGPDDTVLLGRILSSPMPASIKRFFEMDAERWAAEEHARLVSSPHFDYTAEEIRERIEVISRSSRDIARFTRSEFAETLEKAVKLLFNYVCRPQWTLAKYIYADTGTMGADAVLSAMQHFSDYPYYHVVVSDYFLAKRIETIGKEKFEELLSLIDTELVRNYDSSKLARLAEPIFALFNPGDDLDFARVPIEALSIFYDDKGLSSVVERLDIEKEILPTVSMHDLVLLVGEADYTATADISEIVNRRIGSGLSFPSVSMHQEPQNLDIPPIDSMVTDDVIQSFVEELPPMSVEVDDMSSDEAFAADEFVVQDPEAAFPSDAFVITDAGVAQFAEEPVLAGEQETPEFIDFDEELMDHAGEDRVLKDSAPTPVEPRHFEAEELPDDLILSDELFIVESESGVPAIGDEAQRLAHDTTVPADLALDEDENFLKTLTLSDSEFMPVSARRDIDVPDIPALEQPEARRDEGLPVEEAADLPLTQIPSYSMHEEEREQEETDPEKVVAMFGDLRQRISSGDRKKFIKKVFNKNEQAYEQAIDALNGAPSWRQASEHIDDIFLTNNVDMYSRLAVNFTDEIYKRYLKK